MSKQPKISIVIVNYNVKEYLEQALISIQRALVDISSDIWVVDNASVDGSVEHIRNRFPDVKLVESKENLGFGRANNVALAKAQGEFIVMINPDTVVQEDTFSKLLTFFEETPDAGAATCKVINPDGSFSVDCRHSIPTPMIAFWKVTGMSKLFPKSKIFAKYNLTYLDPDDTYPVPGISGCFMMVRKSVLDKVGYFDERFFMYCEDIDLCHRINLSGSKIYYVPTSQIIHYKGESTKKNNIDYVITFNKALYQFFEKYYAQSTVFIYRWIIVFGIVLRGIFVYTRNFLHEHFPQILDMAILNIVLLLSFMLRLEFKSGFTWTDFFGLYWIVNLMSSLIFLIGAYYSEVYPRHRFSIQGIVKANLITFMVLAAVTFFLKQFAFSRMVVLIAAIVSPLLMIGWRSLLKRSYQGDRSAWGKDVFSKPTVIVGNHSSAESLYAKIRDLRDIGYDLRGIITTAGAVRDEDTPGVPVLGQMNNLKELIRIHRIRQVIFSSDMLSYEQILTTMSNISMPQLEYKIAPSNLEFVIGKSSIERFDDYPLLDIDYAIGKPFNRWLKRVFDVLASAAMLVLFLPLALPIFISRYGQLESIEIHDEAGGSTKILQEAPFTRRTLLNRWLLCWFIFRGKLSFVGAPLEVYEGEESAATIRYKPGLTGLVQINADRLSGPEDVEKYHLFYVKNQSIFLDLEILAKAVLR